MVETYDTTLPIYTQILLVWLDNLIFRMRSWRRTIHVIHGPHCSVVFSGTEAHRIVSTPDHMIILDLLYI